MVYNNINSLVILGTTTSQWFKLNCGIRQCPFSPFLFISVVELLSISIHGDVRIGGI